LAVAASAVVVYLNAFGNEFVLDDIRLVRDNVRIRSLANVAHLFASSYWDLEGAQALYRPLVLATYAVNYAVHGLSSSGYVAVNIALHGAVSLLLFALVRGMGGSLYAAGLAGIAFAVHPVHTEAVTGIAGRPELLAALFFLLAMHFHRAAPAARRAVGDRAAALACFGLALLSKESAITLLLVLPVMDALVPARGVDGEPARPRARILADYLPLAGVAFAYLAVRWAVLGGIAIDEGVIAPLDNPLVPVTTLPLGERLGATRWQAIMTALAVVVEYARLLAWPVRLSPDYSYNQLPLVTSAFDPRFIAGVALVAACICGIALLWRRSPLAAFGLAILALTYSIVSNFAITIGTICAERLLYLPSAGLLIAAAVGAERLANTRTPLRRQLVYVVLGVLIAGGTARTWTRNRDWRNELTLWSAAVEAAPQSARVQSEYGRVLMGLAEREARAGRTADAERLYGEAQSHFERALAIYPSYSLPLDGLAMIHSLHDRFDEATALYERALEAWPGNYASLANWGSLLWERCRRDAARAMAQRGEGRIAEADALTREADAGCRQALEKIDGAIALMPSYAHAHLVRAQILETYVGDPAGAASEFEEVLRLAPNHPERTLIERELERLRTQQPAGTPSGGATRAPTP
jgi:tetratricopeptide (TPR) repeat protein